jgi:hypothetical protein
MATENAAPPPQFTIANVYLAAIAQEVFCEFKY